MSGWVAVRSGRVLCAALGVAAVGAAVATTTGGIADFFSYFTIESNLLAIVVLVVGGVGDPRGPRWAYLRGAATLFMVITGVVYAVLLAHQTVGLTSPWINTVLHRVIPVVMLIDWIAFPPWPRASYRAALGWLAVPVAYLAYTLLRGPIANWYPYPFIDPRRPGGYGRVAGYALALTVVMALLALTVNAIGRRRARSS